MDAEIVIGSPQGSQSSYEMDHANGRIRPDRRSFAYTCCQASFGYFPDTLADDGALLDAMVLLSEPAYPGCLVKGRPVGVFWMHDDYGPDAKILAVPHRDPQIAHVQDLGDVPWRLRHEIAHSLKTGQDLRPGKDADVRGWQDRGAAEQILARALARANGSVPVGRRIHRFGVGARARVAATAAAAELRSESAAAVAMFKPAFGGWIVRTYPGGIRQRPGPSA